MLFVFGFFYDVQLWLFNSKQKNERSKQDYVYALCGSKQGIIVLLEKRTPALQAAAARHLQRKTASRTVALHKKTPTLRLLESPGLSSPATTGNMLENNGVTCHFMEAFLREENTYVR